MMASIFHNSMSKTARAVAVGSSAVSSIVIRRLHRGQIPAAAPPQDVEAEIREIALKKLQLNCGEATIQSTLKVW